MHHFPVRVYYSDTDCGGIVCHARYLDFAEHARTELMRELGTLQGREGSQTIMLEEQKLGFVVKSITIDYNSPAFLDDLLDIGTTLESAKRFSLVFRQDVLREGQVLCALTVKVAMIDLTTHRPSPIPDWLASAFASTYGHTDQNC